jgi:acyl carrier protein
MERRDILECLTRHLRASGGAQLTLTEQSRFDHRDLGLNSIQVLSALVTLEDELGVEVDDVLANIGRFETVGELLDAFPATTAR